MISSIAQLCFSKRKILPIILQEETAECGHVCVTMISNFWGHKLDLYRIRKISPPSARGVSLLNLSCLFDKLGFRTRGIRIALQDLDKVKCPAILHWNMNHFVVLRKVTNKRVIIHDPATGARSCTLEEVSRAFTGIVLEVEKEEAFQPIINRSSLTLQDMFKTISGIGKFFTLLIMLSLCLETLHLTSPLFLQYVTDNVIGFNDPHNLYILMCAFIILLFMQVFLEYLRGSMVIYLTNNLTEKFSSNVVQHILKLPLEFFEKRHKGDIQSKFQSIDQIQKKMSTDFINTILDGLMILINFSVLLFYSPMLTALVSLSLVLYTAVRYSSYHFLRNQTELSIVQHAKAASAFLETLQGIVPIKSFLKERLRFNTWRNSYIDSLNADIRVSRANVLYSATNQLLFNMEHILVISMGAALVLNNQFTLGMLMAFLSYRLLLVNKAFSFIQNIFDYRLISIQLNRLSDILFQQPEVILSGFGKKEEVSGALSLKKVSFRYNPNESCILDNITLDIKAGEKVVIIGSSGCGKSTLLKVMLGLLEKTSGEILIDGISIKDFGLKNYRDVTASVMQEDTLLSGSLLDNISFFDEEIDMQQVYKAAELSCIHEVINGLPMGYETLVGEMGSTLSGGQKQRILLARALYKKPRILFLDEATSHLDLENEKNINQSLKALDITQIIIAHREETIRMADRIINLEILINQDT